MVYLEGGSDGQDESENQEALEGNASLRKVFRSSRKALAFEEKDSKDQDEVENDSVYFFGSAGQVISEQSQGRFYKQFFISIEENGTNSSEKQPESMGNGQSQGNYEIEVEEMRETLWIDGVFEKSLAKDLETLCGDIVASGGSFMVYLVDCDQNESYMLCSEGNSLVLKEYSREQCDLGVPDSREVLNTVEFPQNQKTTARVSLYFNSQTGFFSLENQSLLFGVPSFFLLVIFAGGGSLLLLFLLIFLVNRCFKSGDSISHRVKDLGNQYKEAKSESKPTNNLSFIIPTQENTGSIITENPSTTTSRILNLNKKSIKLEFEPLHEENFEETDIDRAPNFKIPSVPESLNNSKASQRSPHRNQSSDDSIGATVPGFSLNYTRSILGREGDGPSKLMTTALGDNHMNTEREREEQEFGREDTESQNE